MEAVGIGAAGMTERRHVGAQNEVERLYLLRVRLASIERSQRFQHFGAADGDLPHRHAIGDRKRHRCEAQRSAHDRKPRLRDPAAVVTFGIAGTDARGRGDPFASLGWAKRLRDYFDAMIQKQFAGAAYQWWYQVAGGITDLQRIASSVIPTSKPRPGSYFLTNAAVKVESVGSNVRAGVSGEGTAYDALLNHVALAFGLNKSQPRASVRGAQVFGAKTHAVTSVRYAVVMTHVVTSVRYDVVMMHVVTSVRYDVGARVSARWDCG
jgi:hypothetical protein